MKAVLTAFARIDSMMTTPGFRRLALATHVTSSVGWLGKRNAVAL